MDSLNEPEKISDRTRHLVDDYLDGLLDESGMRELEESLRADSQARSYFVRFARLHTDLHLEARARTAGHRALHRITQLSAEPCEPAPIMAAPGSPAFAAKRAPGGHKHGFYVSKRALLAAGVLLAVLSSSLLALARINSTGNDRDNAIAWLVNAQDCAWSGPGPTGNLQAGKVLRIDHGLAEIHFQCGARVVLEGPSALELISGKSARLVSGKLTARVPTMAIGFEILSAQGKVVDLGTEFGVRAEDGLTEVYVFEGKVEAHPADGKSDKRTVNLIEHQAAQMAPGGVTLCPVAPAADQFVRSIAPPPVIAPQSRTFAFNRSVGGTIQDIAGLGTGLSHRLPGTGKLLSEQDDNLRLDIDKSQLELTTTNSDLNTQYKLHHGEYLGLRLADLGFTGREDFSATVTIPNIPALEVYGQFGLYAGAKSDRIIRGGLIHHRKPGQYTQFLVNNKEGIDVDFCQVGLLSTGTDLRLTLKRTNGKYSMTIENLTNGSASSLIIPHTDFLDGEKDIHVGLFGANTQSEVRKTLIFKDFQTTVITVANNAR